MVASRREGGLPLTGPATSVRRHRATVLHQPPGRLFHTLLVIELTWLWWALGVPGFAYLPVMPLSAALLAAGCVWAVKFVPFVATGRHMASRRMWLQFAAAPVLVAVFVAAALEPGALSVRWALSRDAFEQTVEQALRLDRHAAATDGSSGRIGLYRIIVVRRVGDAVIFYEAHGSLFDDAGFAYLPDGPTDDLANGNFENPQFEHLEGDWYLWTASW
jgi:hypothetical protein